MSDLIKREDAINSIYKLKKTVIKQDVLSYCDGIFDALEVVQDLPSADRPQGEWIDKGWKGDWQFETDGRGYCWKVFECSICNGEDTRETRFCPHCGAKMKGVDDEID